MLIAEYAVRKRFDQWMLLWAGIKVVIVERASAASSTLQERMMQDIQDALAPDADAP